MSVRATPEERGMTLVECDNCGDDLWNVYLDLRNLALVCDTCGREMNQRMV